MIIEQYKVYHNTRVDWKQKLANIVANGRV